MYVRMYDCTYAHNYASMHVHACMYVYVLYVCIYIRTYVCCVDKPVVEITAVTVGCGYVNISWSTTGNNDECSVSLYNVTISYVTMDDHVIEAMLTAMSSSTITRLPDDTQIIITVSGISSNRDILSVDSTSVKTLEFESMHKFARF